jgi:hypothetical protein
MTQILLVNETPTGKSFLKFCGFVILSSTVHTINFYAKKSTCTQKELLGKGKGWK